MRPDDRIRTVSFARGLTWLFNASSLLRAGAQSLVGIGALWLMISMLAIIPLIGQVTLAVITPLLTGGILIAFDQISANGRPTPGILLAAWSRPKAKVVLLLLGVWTIIGAMVAFSLLASWLGTQVTEQELTAALEAPENLGAFIERLQGGPGLYAAIGVVIAGLMGLYFATPLVVFGEVALWPAVRASFKAIVMNLLAFLAFILTMIMLVVGFGLAVVSIVGVLTQIPGPLGVMLSQVIILVLSMALQITLAGAQYVAFCDIFGWSAK